jgi:hypothetical protein
MKLTVFTEEASMKAALQQLLPSLGMAPGSFRIISFDGVGELENQLPRQLVTLRDDADRILILRDNDCGDCQKRREQLMIMAQRAGVHDRCKVRIVCQMLEAWFVGDVEALERSGLFKTKPIPKRLKSCDPDSLSDPKKELRNLNGRYNVISGAKAIAPHMRTNGNRSTSFRNTMQAVRDLTAI